MLFIKGIKNKLVLFLVILLLVPSFSLTGNACLIKSEMHIEVDDLLYIPPVNSVEVNATLVYKWGAGAFHTPISIEIEKKNLPKWLSASISPEAFTIVTDKLIGGEKKIPLKIILSSKKVTRAFSETNFTICAKAKAIIPIIKNCETEKRIEVMQDFFDNNGKEINVTVPHEIKGRGTYKLTLINNCNGDIVAELKFYDSNGWKVSFNETKFVVPSKFSYKNIKFIKMETKEGRSNSMGKLEITYYPVENPYSEKKKIYTMISLHKEKSNANYGIAVIGVTILTVFLIFYKYKKKRRRKI